MASSKVSLQKAVENDKEQFQAALDQLGDAMKEEVDPRRWVAKSPYASLGLGFGMGALVALMATPWGD
jgi:ElaB/YqjD/DUF883 family membrane-anchored ribosome-binding protein